jgi:hypothetical protein
VRAAARWHRVADSPDRKTARSPSTLGGEEPVKHQPRPTCQASPEPAHRAGEVRVRSFSTNSRPALRPGSHTAVTGEPASPSACPFPCSRARSLARRSYHGQSKRMMLFSHLRRPDA